MKIPPDDIEIMPLVPPKEDDTRGETIHLSPGRWFVDDSRSSFVEIGEVDEEGRAYGYMYLSDLIGGAKRLDSERRVWWINYHRWTPYVREQFQVYH